jgi:hypothetical protein
MERELQMKPQINDGGPAFPMTGEGCHNPLYSQSGMTLRDYFAGQALAGMPWSYEISRKDQAQKCFQIADAMLAERETKK